MINLFLFAMHYYWEVFVYVMVPKAAVLLVLCPTPKTSWENQIQAAKYVTGQQTTVILTASD